MGFLFATLYLDVVTLVACLITAVYVYFRYKFSYWKKRNAPYVEPQFPFGNFKDVLFLRKTIGEQFRDLYRELDGEKFGGMFTLTQPGFIFRDPDIIKSVLVKDFSSFHDHGFYGNEEREPLTGHLFVLNGNRWRNLRNKLTPTFTSGKTKMMFPIVADCGHELGSILMESASKEETIEMKDILARYSTDVIASCAFGIQCNCLKIPDAEFRQWGRKLFETSVKQLITRMVSAFVPALPKILKLKFFDPEVSKRFISMVEDTVNYREKTGFKRNDFLQLLIEIRNKGKVEEVNGKAEENIDGIVEDKSGEIGMYLQFVLHVNKYIYSFIFFRFFSHKMHSSRLLLIVMLPLSSVHSFPA
jgi:cytochrome P450 family 6